MEGTGVLVGWSHQDWGNKVILAVETVHDRKAAPEPDVLHIFMTKNQAAVLADYLFKASGRLPPSQGERSIFKRLLG